MAGGAGVDIAAEEAVAGGDVVAVGVAAGVVAGDVAFASMSTASAFAGSASRVSARGAGQVTREFRNG
jgi:hypothetical protein